MKSRGKEKWAASFLSTNDSFSVCLSILMEILQLGHGADPGEVSRLSSVIGFMNLGT